MRSRLSSVRARATLGATVVVGIAAVIAAIALVAVLRSALTESVRDSAEITAADAVAAYERGDEVTGGAFDDDVVVELVEPGAQPTTQPFARAVSAEATTQDGTTIVVWRTLEDVDEATRVAAWSLAVGIPVLLLVVAGTTWWVVGRALRPVEAVRAEVEAVSGSELHRRVPVPDTDDEIQRLAVTMNRMLDRLEQSQRPAAAVRLRRLARAALADRIDPAARRGGAGPSGAQRLGGSRVDRARGGRSAAADR